MVSTALPHERGHGIRKCGPVALRFHRRECDLSGKKHYLRPTLRLRNGGPSGTAQLPAGRVIVSRFRHHLNLRFKKSLRAAEQAKEALAYAAGPFFQGQCFEMVRANGTTAKYANARGLVYGHLG
jgi:hypothetical protein